MFAHSKGRSIAWDECQTCPNRAPIPVEAELRITLRMLANWCDDNVTDPAVTVPLNRAKQLLAKLDASEKEAKE
jgi:hypothetical protein